MERRCILLWIVVAGIILPFATSAQFTYLGGNLSFQGKTYGRSMYARDKMSHAVWDLNLGVMVRPVQRVAIGGALLLPISQGGNTGFGWSKTSDGSTFRNFNSIGDNEDRYLPQVYNYQMERSMGFRIQGRFFFDLVINSYMDLGATMYTMSESFSLQRAAKPPQYWDSGGIRYGAVPGRSISVRKDHPLTIPEIGLGMMPHIGRHLYLDMRVAMSFVSFGRPSFSEVVEYRWGVWDVHETVTLESPLQGSRNLMRFEAGLGYYF